MKARCKKMVPHRGAGYGLANQCSNRAAYGDFCGLHSPKADARRRAKAEALYTQRENNRQAALSASEEHDRRANAYPGLMREIKRLKAPMTPTSPASSQEKP